jgi:hypothetical protein
MRENFDFPKFVALSGFRDHLAFDEHKKILNEYSSIHRTARRDLRSTGAIRAEIIRLITRPPNIASSSALLD